MAKYTNEELNRIQEQYAELVEDTESEPNQAEFREDALADDDGREEDSPPS